MIFHLFVALSAMLAGEERRLTLNEAVAIALKQNPDLVLARLEEQKANLAIRVARDPFHPKFYAGSGLAYSYGFPMSIEGSAPSIVQARGIAAILNKPFSHRVAQVTEAARTATLDTEVRRDEVALQTAMLYLDTARWTRAADTLRQQLASFERAGEVIAARVREGRELEIEAKRSALNLARTHQRLEVVELQRDYAEASLAVVLGFDAGDRVRAASTEPRNFEYSDQETTHLDSAIENSREIRRLESAILAKGHELRQYKATRLPSIDLVAQYGLFGKFNNYEDFFRRFQRHNGQLGISLQVPLFPSYGSQAQAGQAETELAGLRAQVTHTRNRLRVETQRSFRNVKLMERGREVARLGLEVAREQVNILLAQSEEGRAGLRQLEEARVLEQERWLEYFDAQFALERAKLELLKNNGTLLAALQ